MMPGAKHLDLLVVLLLAVLPLSGCDEAVTLESQWRSRPVTIDGDGAEWPETRQYFEKDSNVLISLMNDDDNVYIRLVMRRKDTQMMLLHGGLITWIDNSGGSDKQFGVQFPLAKENHMQDTPPDYKDRNSMPDVLEDSLQTLSVIDNRQGNRQARTVSMAEAAEMGIYAGLGMDADCLVYELQVPYSVSGENKTIGVGFETGKGERPTERKPPGGGGEMTRGMGGPPPKGRPGGPPPGDDSGEPFSMWATVQLVENPTTSTQLNRQDRQVQ